jgi:hypothetical protein
MYRRCELRPNETQAQPRLRGAQVADRCGTLVTLDNQKKQRRLSCWLQRLVRSLTETCAHHPHLKHRTPVDLRDALHHRVAQTLDVAQRVHPRRLAHEKRNSAFTFAVGSHGGCCQLRCQHSRRSQRADFKYRCPLRR